MRIAIIGARGLVGRELTDLLQKRGEDPLLFNSESNIHFDKIDLAFFCVPTPLAKNWIPEAVKKGVVCIDSSSAFRKDPTVPLVIPEINEDALHTHQGIIASPNCTTTLLLLPLAPLHRKFQIKRIFAATYQAISGAGAKGLEAFENETRAFFDNRSLKPTYFPHIAAFNVFPHEGAEEEEEKIKTETKKILNDDSILISAMCTRVPVFRAHAIAANVEFVSPLAIKEAFEILNKSPGIIYKNSPTSLDASQNESVLCGRLREDKTKENTLELWIVGDQLLKGAALNMVHIAEKLCLNSEKKTVSGGSSLR